MSAVINDTKTPWLAYLAAIMVIFIWSGWFIVSRLGVQTPLTPEDITGLRYTSAALVTSPLWFRYNWRAVNWPRASFIALGCGFPYTLLCFYGLQTAKAASGGILVNGLLPVIGAVLAIFWLKVTISRLAWLGIGLALVANILMMLQGISFEQVNAELLVGLSLLVCASFVFACYMTAVKAWPIGLKDALVLVPLINAVLFLPIWLMSDTALFIAPLSDIVGQVIYQGIVVSIGALWLITYQVQKLGATTASVFLAFVPTMTAILGWLLLAEPLNKIEIASLIICTLGLVLYAFSQRRVS